MMAPATLLTVAVGDRVVAGQNGPAAIEIVTAGRNALAGVVEETSETAAARSMSGTEWITR